MADKKRRRIIKDLDKHRDRAKYKELQEELSGAGLYPLTAPGMPMPGPDFIDHARRLGDTSEEISTKVKDEKTGRNKTVKSIDPGEILEDLYRRALREPGFEIPIQVKAGVRKPVRFVPGHIWGQHAKEYRAGKDMAVDGPRPADVMVIGKMPGSSEVQEGRNMIGPSGELLIKMLRDLKIKGTAKWYVTNLLKFNPPDGAAVKASWIRDCLPLLHQELRIVRPKYILCLGTDASKALLGTKYNVSYMEGRVLDFEFPINMDGEEVLHKSLVMTAVHPAAVARSPDMGRTLERSLARFNLLKEGTRWDKSETDIDHRAIRSLDELKDLLWEIKHDPEQKSSMMAVDAEWHGEHPVNEGSYVRTIQFAWREKHACAVVLRGPGGKVTFRDADGKPAIKRGIKLLNKFFANKRVTGHFFNSDLEWLVHLGLDLRKQFKTPLRGRKLEKFGRRLRRAYVKLGFADGEVVPAWLRSKFEGGADTGLMAHAIEETAMLGLESLAMRYTSSPRYDVPLYEWRVAYCKEHGLKSKDLEGYGECPDEVLVPYGIYDADATLRLFNVLDKLLDCDYEGNCCREAFWEAMLACPAILEMHQTGIPIDKTRIDYLTEVFMEARLKTEKKIQEWAKWPTFNIRSVQQVREFLFGEQLNGKVTTDGSVARIRPPDGRALYVKPLITTSKPTKQWWEIEEKGLTGEYSPSTNKMVLAILAQDNEEEADQINWIRDYRFLDQVLKSLLRPPVTDDEGNWMYESEGVGLGGLLFDAGLASVICSDGRVRTHFYPTTETGRWRSARPNLQNISKARDPDYYRMLGATKNDRGKWVGGKYKYKLRSILKAPHGHVLIESDYIGAELFGMAMMAGDLTMIEHCRRNQLHDDDPDFYDIHSNVAIFAFKLGCAPTKEGLEEIGKAHLRIVAKSVIFGIAYGRGAKAIALAAKEQGVQITSEEAQQVIDAILEMYPGLVPLFQECCDRALNEGWLCHCFGRFRRFPKTNDFKLQGEFERQAKNFPIQGMIASAMNRAAAEMYYYRESIGIPDMYRMTLQIHDALVLQVPYRHVERVVDEVMPVCMVSRVPIYPTSLDGVPTGAGPYRLGIDTDVMSHWGENITKEQALKWGIPLVTKKGNVIAS